ncbi:MAG: flagellar export chaperone FlgN [Bdellovibrionales bacterium]|nr:flagellar export chaperone FlgN [Bdellovibrionales bacterium]
MADIFELLKEKNYYLERFLQESRKERQSFKARRFDNLEPLYKKREQILANISSIDVRISKICEEAKDEILNGPGKDEISKLLKKIKDNVRYIMEEDLEIISCIENEKSKIIKEISQTKEGRRVLRGYKAI